MVYFCSCFLTCAWFACMYGCAPLRCLLPAEIREGRWITWNWWYQHVEPIHRYWKLNPDPLRAAKRSRTLTPMALHHTYPFHCSPPPAPTLARRERRLEGKGTSILFRLLPSSALGKICYLSSGYGQPATQPTATRAEASVRMQLLQLSGLWQCYTL